ncbi:MAG TPA: ATP-binding cassette domain-containing protein [Patescibacteria group bacterium]|nr:ATP-binding cassette domain-containing protein [Patescibacteria group bacterium]
MIEFKSVTKKYFGGKYALNKATFTIDQGEFVYLIGPSGAGKTTILKMLIRELSPSSGKILYNGHDITKFSKGNVARLRRKIRIVFQDFKILYDRTLLENVMLSLYILGRRGKEAEVEAKKVLKLVGLEGKHAMFPVQISAGELQRVAIARALAGGSEVLLADEPTGNLDPATGGDIVKLLEEIHEEGTTVIVTTHNAELVDRSKRRVIELSDGTVARDEQEGRYHAS